MEKSVKFIIIGIILECTLTCITCQQYGTQFVQSIKLFWYQPTKREAIDITFFDLMGDMDTSRPLKVLIHGWNSNRDHISIEPVKNAYLARGTDNLIIVDWSEGATQLYDVSRSLVPRVGLRIGEMLQAFMDEKNIPVENTHIIGHSLGAHIAGNVGKYFKGKLDRVTGLDPAGPLFRSYSWDAIAPNDATFVDVIHTGIGSAGELTARGTADFYPNRGFNPQPGCRRLDTLTAFSCSHFRAPQYFAESIISPMAFSAAECSEDEILHAVALCLPGKNLDGPRGLVYMGENVDRNASGIYYLDTNALAPYGKGQNLYDDYTD
uniref:CSON008132 protein n=1 Tax=Culicoides sonorensis TaxID=179676 RepID=A0A336LYB0_CULSO